MSEFCLLPAHVQLQRLRTGVLSASELLAMHLDRVARHNPRLNALCVLDAERATARAKAADAALARGTPLGPLHGLPMTVKESFDIPGLPTTWGLARLRDHVPDQPAWAVQRLQDAGAVIFGKSNVPASLADWQTFNPVYGTTNNPWDLARGPGGSSGGSAAALAAGLTALELGSDIGASIRNPAHYCGVWGHKPTWGLLSLQGQQLPGTLCADTLDLAVIGPLARSAHDLVLAVDVLTQPLRCFSPRGWQPAAWRDAGRAPAQMRVAVLADDPVAPVDQEVQGAIAELVRFLRDAGVQVNEDARPVDSRVAWETYVWLLRGATGAKLDDEGYAQAERARDAADAAAPAANDYARWVWHASTQSHRDWVRHDQQRQRLRMQWEAFFETHDLLVCPVATTPAFKHQQQGMRWERMLDVNGVPQASTDQLFWAGYPGVVGLPATAVPLGLSAQGLPIGVQLIGPALGDPVCLRMARWLEDGYRSFVAPPGWD